MGFYDTNSALRGMNQAKALQAEVLQNQIQSSQNHANAQKELIGQGTKTLSDTFGSILKTVSDHQDKKQRKENIVKALKQGGADKRYIAMAQNMDPDDALKLINQFKQIPTKNGYVDPLTGKFIQTQAQTENKNQKEKFLPLTKDQIEFLNKYPVLRQQYADMNLISWNGNEWGTPSYGALTDAILNSNQLSNESKNTQKTIEQLKSQDSSETSSYTNRRPYSIFKPNNNPSNNPNGSINSPEFDQKIKDYMQKKDSQENRTPGSGKNIMRVLNKSNIFGGFNNKDISNSIPSWMIRRN